jgi:GT2 family glycosyltransferase
VAQITTIIPTFRRPALLRRSIQSVLDQSYRDFELRVYDNASGDETMDVVQAISSRDARVRYFSHENNIGLIENFAFGMNRVSTPYFNLLSDDDIILPGFFETAVHELATHDEAMAFVGGLVEADPSGRAIRLPFANWKPGLLDPSEAIRFTSRDGMATWTSTLFRSKLLQMVGGLDARFGLAVDTEFQLRVLAHYPVIFRNVPSGVFFYNLSSASRNERLSETASTLARILCELNSPRFLLPVAISDQFKARFREMIFGKARAAACDGNFADALSAADILRRDFDATREASVIALMASSTWNGILARTTFVAARRLLRIWRRVLSSIACRKVNSAVANTLAQLELRTQS